MTIEPVSFDDPLAALPRLALALRGEAPLIPYAGHPPALPPLAPDGLPDRLAVVVGTSGSTGTPKLALLTAPAMAASAAGTEEVLDGPGSWLLAVPPQHIAGLQVLARSILAGTTPVVMDLRGGFTPAGFAAAAARLPQVRNAPGGPRPTYTSLVPTQVARLLEEEDGRAALRRFTAVLVGGAALAPVLRERAGVAGVRLVATYGMSETAGGCVYDGRPLPGVVAELEEDPRASGESGDAGRSEEEESAESGAGRILLGGATLASGYLNPATGAITGGEAFVGTGERRRLRTDDMGRLLPDGRLQVLGRRDDMILTGAMKVHPRVVEEAIMAAYPHVSALVVGLPDPQWGQRVAAALVGDPVPDLAGLREGLRSRLPAYALPRALARLDELPQRGPGKPDRRAVAAMGEWQT